MGYKWPDWSPLTVKSLADWFGKILACSMQGCGLNRHRRLVIFCHDMSYFKKLWWFVTMTAQDDPLKLKTIWSHSHCCQILLDWHWFWLLWMLEKISAVNESKRALLKYMMQKSSWYSSCFKQQDKIELILCHIKVYNTF